MRRGCLFGLVGAFGLCVVGCGLLYFLALPNIRDSVQSALEDGMTTVVAGQIPAIDGVALPDTYEITQEELQQSIAANLGSGTMDDIQLTIDPVTGFSIGLSSQGGQGATYTGLPTVEDGKLVLTNMESSDGFLDFVVPADRIGDAIEDAVNGYLAANGLTIQSLEVLDGKIDIVTAAV